MKNQKLKILFTAGEAVPFIKTGGLADVAGSLPAALAALGHDVRVMMPKYNLIPGEFKARMTHLCHFSVRLGWREQYCGIETMEYGGVIFYFVDNEFYFGGNTLYEGPAIDVCERFCFFSRALLESIRHIDFVPDVIHCNDWQTGMIPFLLKTQYGFVPEYSNISTVFTIHNLRYQGLFPFEWVNDLLSIDARYFTYEHIEFYNCASFIKAGITAADKLTTVSPTYANEIMTPFYGERLDGTLSHRHADLSGIINGIDPKLFDPSTDKAINTNYSLSDMHGKALCKHALQEELWLDRRADVPLIGMVTRFADHKGIELVEHVIDDIMRSDVQLAALGTGDERYERMFRSAAQRYGGRVSVKTEHSDALARRMYAGADIFLMPSQYEPCGLAQMIAMRYGTVPVVRETGGLHDTVVPYNKYTGEGNGFSFKNYNAHEMLFTLECACEAYHNREIWDNLVARAMKTELFWDNSAKEYIELYKRSMSEPHYPV